MIRAGMAPQEISDQTPLPATSSWTCQETSTVMTAVTSQRAAA